MTVSRAEFERIAEKALESMPEQFFELMDNIVIQVEDEPDGETLRGFGLDPLVDTIYGLYTGVPLEERGGWYGGVLPDVVVLYRVPLVESFPERDRLIREIQLTLLHEIGHHLGFDEEGMDAWEDDFEAMEDSPGDR